MPREFNIDDYQYMETLIPQEVWLQSYKIQGNHLLPTARFGGLLYEHDGAQWEHVVSQYGNLIWTLYREDDGQLYVRNGLRVKGRIGYFIGRAAHNAHETTIVTGVTDSALEHQACGT